MLGNIVKKSLFFQNHFLRPVVASYISSNANSQPAKIPYVELPKYRFGFNNLPELDNAPEVIQKIFSLEYADDAEYRKCAQEYNKEKYETKLERNIVNNTCHIRMLVEKLKEHPREKKGKVFLIWAIDQRKKRLKRLMKEDIDKYLKIIKEYDIPPLESPHAPKNKYKFRKYKINVPLEEKRNIEDFEKERVY